ncbi:MAG TPA: ABC transporter substrate binding protein [Candidatus Cloacimonadota bacterium]|nr:ABC transporter substrate binding protein [Candidatus Cloacimonadota bacterium]
MELWLGAFNLGLMYGFLALGVFITSRILDFADITVDGTFTTGAAVGAVFLVQGMHPVLAILLAFLAGMVCGSITGFIHTKFKIDSLLAGILVMTALYSVNLHIMGRSNIPLMNSRSIISLLEGINPGLHSEIWLMIVMSVIMAIIWIITALFFRTDLGLTLRSTGDNAIMTEAGGVNVNAVKVFGVALANGFVAIAGCFIAQYQGFADVGMGIGTLVIGLASVIMGETVIKSRSIGVKLLAVILGAVIYRYMIALALFAGMNPIDLKLITALFVLITLILSHWSKIRKTRIKRHPVLYWILLAAVIIGGSSYYLVHQNIRKSQKNNQVKSFKIGVVQISQNGILNITRDAFLKEMKRLGYDENTEFIIQSADSDISTLNTILDSFQSADCDLILTISTPATQAAVNKISDTPLVFATVANPFVFGAGKSETEHRANVTGTYGWVPMDQLVDLSQEIFPQKKIVGTMGNPGEANTNFYLEILRNTVHHNPELSLKERTISAPTDVYEASVSLVNQGAEVFILPVDNIIYSSFDSILKAAAPHQIPIFSSDVDRLKDGALVSYGYDYASSGIQAAHLVQRILNGEDPAGIPFERYKKMVFGLNLKVAHDYGIEIPDRFIDRADKIIEPNGSVTSKTPTIGLVEFSEHPTSTSVKRGVYDALADQGFVNGINIEITERSGNADFQMINAITQDFIARDVDIIVPLSTPCLQSALQMTAKTFSPDIVFSFVSDPFAAGAGQDATHHISNVTGFSCVLFCDEVLDAIQEFFPQRKNIGVVWNSSEANSQSILKEFRAVCKERNFNLLEVTISTPNEVLEATRSVIHKGADLIMCTGDNTVSTSFDSVIKAASARKIPVVSDNVQHVAAGAVMSVGTDFYINGYDAGRYVARVIKGEKPADLPIIPTKQMEITVNSDIAAKYGWEIPSSLLDRAKIVGKRPIRKFAPEAMAINLRLAKEYGVTISDKILATAQEVIK